jgi:hypothetical protein
MYQLFLVSLPLRQLHPKNKYRSVKDELYIVTDIRNELTKVILNIKKIIIQENNICTALFNKFFAEIKEVNLFKLASWSHFL